MAQSEISFFNALVKQFDLVPQKNTESPISGPSKDSNILILNEVSDLARSLIDSEASAQQDILITKNTSDLYGNAKEVLDKLSRNVAMISKHVMAIVRILQTAHVKSALPLAMDLHGDFVSSFAALFEMLMVRKQDTQVLTNGNESRDWPDTVTCMEVEGLDTARRLSTLANVVEEVTKFGEELDALHRHIVEQDLSQLTLGADFINLLSTGSH